LLDVVSLPASGASRPAISLEEQRDAVVLVDAQGEMREHRGAVVAHACALHGDHRRRDLFGFGEGEAPERRLLRGGGEGQPLDHLQPRLRLPGLGGLGPEPVDEALQMRAPGLDPAVLGLGGGEPGGAGLGEGVVGPGIIGQLAVFEVQDAGHRAVEQVAVVADDDHGMGIAREVVFEPERAFEVEVVRGFVEQQHIGPREQHRRERHAHPPAAGKIGAGPGLGGAVEAKPAQDRGGPRLGRPGVDIAEPGLDFGDAVRIGGVLGLGHQRGALDIGGKHGVEQAVVGRRGLLRDAADSGALGQGDLAGFQRELAPDQPKQRGLARAVAPDEAHLVAIGDHGGGVFDQRAAFDRIGDVIHAQHGGSLPEPARGVNHPPRIRGLRRQDLLKPQHKATQLARERPRSRVIGPGRKASGTGSATGQGGLWPGS